MIIIKPKFLWLLFLYTAFLLLNLFGIKQFEAWDQVALLWESEVNPFLFIGTGHPHVSRYITAYPGFILEGFIPKIGFSMYITLFLVLNCYLFGAIARLTIQRGAAYPSYTLLVVLHFAMNGRGVIAWSAWLLCVWVCLRVVRDGGDSLARFGLMIVSIWFSAVSTGVFILTVSTFSLFVLLHLLKFRFGWVRGLTFLVVSSPFIYYIGDYFLLSAVKNVEYYGGGIDGVFNMLEHGLGFILVDLTLVNLLFFWFASYLFLAFSYICVMNRSMNKLDLFIVISILGGIFGFTVLTLALPLIVLRMQDVFTRLASSSTYLDNHVSS